MGSFLTQAILFACLAVLFYLWITRPLPGFEDAWQLRVISLAMTAESAMYSLFNYGIISAGSVVWLHRQERQIVKMFNHHKLPKFKEKSIKGVKTQIFSPDDQEQKESGNEKTRQLPAIVYYHGGGFYFPADAVHERHCKDLAEKIEGIVISVDYSLSPENKIPKAFDECLAVTKHVLDHPEEFGIDPNRVVLMGDSAGGAITVSVSYRLAKEQERINQPKFQVLMHPMLQVFSTLTTSYKDTLYRPNFLSKRNMCMYASALLTGTLDYVNAICNDSHTEHLKDTIFSSYLQYPPADALPRMKLSDVTSPILPLESLLGSLNPDYFPFMSDDLTRMLPTFIVTSEYDALKDEGWAFAHRLKKSGIRVVHKHYHTFHDSHLFCYSPLCTKSGAEILKDTFSFLTENI